MAWHDGPKERDHPDVEAYLADLSDEQRAICDQVRAAIKAGPDVVEGIAWGIPFYFRKGPLCYTSAAKTHVTIGIAKGLFFDDPHGLLKGTGKSPITKYVAKLGKPLPEGALEDWIAAALRMDDEP